jgi:hypothetical protein
MRYALGTSLLPVTPAELLLAERVPFCELPDNHLLLFDETVSEFFFEFEPQLDIERFLQHGHFGTIHRGKLIACCEDLFEMAAIQRGTLPSKRVIVDFDSTLPMLLRFAPLRESLATIRNGGEFRGQLTVCNCGIAGCFSQYAWARDACCVTLFTIDGARLTEVEWLPFWIEFKDTKSLAAT